MKPTKIARGLDVVFGPAIPDSTSHWPDAQLHRPGWGPLVATSAEYGIKRGMAFFLAREKLVDVFHIGRKVFVSRASLEALPARMAAKGQPS